MKKKKQKKKKIQTLIHFLGAKKSEETKQNTKIT